MLTSRLLTVGRGFATSAVRKEPILLFFLFPNFASTKDYIEKIDYQELFIAVVNWPNSELYGAFVCIMHYLDQSATS